MKAIFASLFIISNASGLFANEVINKPVDRFDSQLSWTKTYLLNEVFRVNYSSLYQNAKDSGSDLDKFWLDTRSINYMKAAYLTAKINNNINEKNPLLPVFKEHISKLKNDKLGVSNWKSFATIKTSVSLSNLLNSFLDESELPMSLGDKWKKSYVSANASCELSLDKKNSFIKMQESRVANSLPITASNVLSSIEKWGANEVLCLVIELSRYPVKDKENRKYSPLPLLQTLDAVSSSLMADERLQVVYGTELFKRRHYAASLRVLFKLQEKENSYKLP